MCEIKFYSFQEILDFIGIEFEFNQPHRKYPFNRGEDNVEFSWGQVLIPKYGIKETVQNKISDIKNTPINEIKMIYQIPFVENNNTGLINQDISLSFRYDKEYKYGTINKSIYECCFWILTHASMTNDFYIITDEMVQEFFSYYVINNQWGIGRMQISSPPQEKYDKRGERERRLKKLLCC